MAETPAGKMKERLRNLGDSAKKKSLTMLNKRSPSVAEKIGQEGKVIAFTPECADGSAGATKQALFERRILLNFRGAHPVQHAAVPEFAGNLGYHEVRRAASHVRRQGLQPPCPGRRLHRPTRAMTTPA